MTPITRQQIESLKIGDYVQQTFDVEAFTGKLKDNARWQAPAEVVEITHRGVSVADRAYVGVYTRTGTETGRMGFSIVEGENFCRLVVTSAWCAEQAKQARTAGMDAVASRDLYLSLLAENGLAV